MNRRGAHVYWTRPGRPDERPFADFEALTLAVSCLMWRAFNGPTTLCTDQGGIAHLPRAQWSDRLPRLVQSRIVEAFESGSRLRAVGTPGDKLAADYQLVTDVRAFNVSINSEPVAEVEISAKVVSDRGGRVLASKVFRASVPAASAQGADAVVALDEAFRQVISEMVAWASRVV